MGRRARCRCRRRCGCGRGREDCGAARRASREGAAGQVQPAALRASSARGEIGDASQATTPACSSSIVCPLAFDAPLTKRTGSQRTGSLARLVFLGSVAAAPPPSPPGPSPSPPPLPCALTHPPPLGPNGVRPSFHHRPAHGRLKAVFVGYPPRSAALASTSPPTAIQGARGCLRKTRASLLKLMGLSTNLALVLHLPSTTDCALLCHHHWTISRLFPPPVGPPNSPRSP